MGIDSGTISKPFKSFQNLPAIPSTLEQFQCATPTKADTRRLVLALHRNRVHHRRSDARVLKAFDERWSELENCFSEADLAYVPPLAARVPEDVRVLVVDDEAAQRSGLAQMIRVWGMNAETAGEGNETLALIESWLTYRVSMRIRGEAQNCYDSHRRCCRTHGACVLFSSTPCIRYISMGILPRLFLTGDIN
jgi:hypothetical protein